MAIIYYRPQVNRNFYDVDYFKNGKFDPEKNHLAASDRLNELSGILNNGISKILDVGSALLGLKELIKRNYPLSQIYTLDISYDLLKLLEDKGTNNHSLADACEIPFKDESFDLVILSDIVEHVTSPQKIIEESHRVLSDDGFLYISTPNKYSLAFLKGKNYFLEADKSHTFVPSKSNIKELVEGYFKITNYTTIFDFLKKTKLRERIGPLYSPYFGLNQRVIAIKETKSS